MTVGPCSNIAPVFFMNFLVSFKSNSMFCILACGGNTKNTYA